ncbi:MULTISPECIES: alkene reductase, partial [Alphaproteobacteria]|uniref:alkene reductase n=1 Tax=Alphaproteobacteria TaxID=28211 RepID=UPI0032669001
MTKSTLFDTLSLGDLTLPNRVVMAPLTRNRAQHDGDVPHALNAEYYAQRASAGLIISEATQISPEGKGYAFTPGIYSDEQVKGWQQVTDAVHAKDGRIFAQLWHVGRISHSSLQPDNQAPVAPSAIAAKAQVFDGAGFVPTSKPRALTASDIARVVDDYRKAAINAKNAGFDGIELHAANGYLLDQFLRDGSNARTDEYGGSPENRARLVVEVLEALAEVWDAGRIGIRLSPFSQFNGIDDSDPMVTFSHVVKKIDELNIGYLHLIEGETGGERNLPEGKSIDALKSLFSGVYMANNGYDQELATDAVAAKGVDLVAFGRPFIANPDLVERLVQGAQLNTVDEATLYGGGREGYTDYP